ncbi:MAG: hypothetical protein M5U14_06270 [Acidimicrobiia bacterium]|nr:hypothetical protein [Acidimicrobiia bacterium]
MDFPGRAVDLDRVLDPTTPEHAADVYGDSGPGWTASHFRRWVTVCTVVDPVPGTYLLQVTTATKADGSPAPAGGGHNRFALRTHLEGDLAGGGTSMFGDGRMAIYANAPTANTTFFLARVHPGASGRTLNLLFYDTGDAPGDSTGTLTVLPPVEATVDPAGGGAVPLTTFAGCTYTAPPGNSAGPPFGADTATGVGCSVSGVSSSRYNGQWVHWRVPIPDGYQCDLGSPFGCWLRINFSFTGRVTDTTTWTAYLDGNPVRLVE